MNLPQWDDVARRLQQQWPQVLADAQRVKDEEARREAEKQRAENEAALLVATIDSLVGGFLDWVRAHDRADLEAMLRGGWNPRHLGYPRTVLVPSGSLAMSGGLGKFEWSFTVQSRYCPDFLLPCSDPTIFAIWADGSWNFKEYKEGPHDDAGYVVVFGRTPASSGQWDVIGPPRLDPNFALLAQFCIASYWVYRGVAPS